MSLRLPMVDLPFIGHGSHALHKNVGRRIFAHLKFVQDDDHLQGEFFKDGDIDRDFGLRLVGKAQDLKAFIEAILGNAFDSDLFPRSRCQQTSAKWRMGCAIERTICLLLLEYSLNRCSVNTKVRTFAKLNLSRLD
ncbi:MAG: hypothetical protein M2R45_03565 [Verrucomicrobia subdivision 3 bacterium]|nr:hypothetical protein [Limisphaerales bacterium]MCS1414803.1 hypothetical protein [Limisphaerales bacterium]